MLLSINRGDAELEKYMHKIFLVLYLGNVREDLGRCTMVTDEVFDNIPPLSLCCHIIDNHKDKFIFMEHLLAPVTLVPLVEERKLLVSYLSVSIG